MKNFTYFRYLRNGIRFAILSILFAFTQKADAQSLTLVSPNGGEVWTYGQSATVTWSGSNLTDLVSLEFTANGGVTWSFYGNTPSSPTGGNVQVSIPNLPTNNAYFRVTDYNNQQVSDMSDNPYTVVVQPITIYTPYAGGEYFNNNSMFVNWEITAAGISQINAEISVDNGQTYIPVAQNIPAQNLYTYILISATPSDSCYLKLYNAADPSQFGISAMFTLLSEPEYTITSPAGGEVVNTSEIFNITWEVENLYTPYAYLEFSADNGQTWEVIANVTTGAGSAGSYEWFTPEVTSEEVRIRITDGVLIDIQDVSEAFTLFPFPETPICMVTVDSLSGYNTVIWEKPVSDIIDVFLVYKETDVANVYEVIDTVGYDEEPVVADPSSNSAMRPYRYKLGFIDFEGMIFPASDLHQTIHLTMSQGVNDSWNLIWTPYQGFDYSTYFIMRKSGEGAYEQIATVSASFTSFTDLNAPAGEVSYMVGVTHPTGCNPVNRDGEIQQVFSNIATNSAVQVNEMTASGFNVYPNPASESTRVTLVSNEQSSVKITLNDITGRTVWTQTYKTNGSTMTATIDLSAYREGMYILTADSGKERKSTRIVINR